VTQFGGFALLEGDNDMFTRPGRTTSLAVHSELQFDATRTRVLAKVFFRCREEEEDNTTFEGEITFQVYEAPIGRTILEIYKAEKYAAYAHATTLEGRLHDLIPLPVEDTHWSNLECRVDQWFGGDQRAVGFDGTLDFQVVFAPDRP